MSNKTNKTNKNKEVNLFSKYEQSEQILLETLASEDEYKNYIAAIKAIPIPEGVEDTFRNHAIYFVASLGFTADEINAYRSAMIDGTPETLTATLDSYSVTNTLTNVVNDNDATTATEFQPYTAKITPSNGFVIENITVSMVANAVQRLLNVKIWR